jgi:hypothetical protein
MSAFKSLLCVVCLAGSVACGEPGFTVKYAPGYSPKARHVSVFGIKRDGLMNRGGWAALGPGLSPAFNGNACEVAYGDSMFNAVPDLATAVDDYVRGNGVSDDLLAELAPAAKGDTIMLLTIAGHPLLPPGDAGSMVHAANPPSSSSHARHRGGAGSENASKSKSNQDPFEISATFYSVAEHRSVAFIDFSSDGTRIDEAISEFRNKLEQEFPGSTCSGWDWTVQLDAANIRKLAEQ